MNVLINNKENYYNEILECVKPVFDGSKKRDASFDLLLKSNLLRIFWIMEKNSCIHPYT